jgi:hypothetical protein
LRVPDSKLAELETQGFTIVEGFVEPDILAAAREALFAIHPNPEAYFADPAAHPRMAMSQFSGIDLFPYPSWALNRLVVLDGLLDAARRFLGDDDIELYKVELWAKYAGAVDYEQRLHRDYGNHTLVVPSSDPRYRQLTTFILLSDVTEADAPTKVVPLAHSRDIPLEPRILPQGALADVEIPVVGPAGTLFMYRTDVLHRGTGFSKPGRSRFVMLCDFKRRGPAWLGKIAWPDRAERKGWREAMSRMTPEQRDIFGFPRPGDPYWTEETIAGVQARYPHMDMSPYRSAMA